MALRTIIIEDEENSLQVICSLLAEFAPDFELCGTADSVDKSVQLIETIQPQVVFTDVQIADGTGFDVLRKLSSRNFELVCLTAHNSYAVEAVRFSAIDYLLKPIGIPEFEAAVTHIRERINAKRKHEHIDLLLHNLAQFNTQDKKISIATVNGYEFVDIKDIIWCGAESSYTIFHLANNTQIISSRNLGYYESLLCSNNFCRIHHTSIINMRFIKSYIKGKSGYVVMSNGSRLEVSQRRKNDFLNMI
ncbi:LytR/AlgR family response regulator transcription factor [Chitinophaga solisilvae]|uniref:Response regulator transcription factor n=1 Tax=Chitinophaga solisilvae TaxID=1233460 RepID=A0A433W9H9_9BACT|nr:LytTR family DNA-binding domain-containing protein [Chitinophaga solisilvae]NSL85305.1 response regulator transcription factor [Chitinophaga solisilvae]